MISNTNSTVSKDENELIEKFEKKFNKEKEIVDIFNNLSEVTYQKYYSKLEIKDDEKLIIFPLLENKLKNLEQTAQESNNNIMAILAIVIFKTLFIDEKSFKIKGLQEKKNYFNVLLKLYNNEKIVEPEEKNVISDMKKVIQINQYYLFGQLIKDFDGYMYFAYCFYLLFESCPSNKVYFDTFINFLIFLLKGENNNNDIYFDFDKNVTESELGKMSSTNLLIDLYAIYLNSDNYTIIFIEDRRLKCKKMDLDKIEKIILQNKENIEEKKQKKKNKIKRKNKKEEKKSSFGQRESNKLKNNIINSEKIDAKNDTEIHENYAIKNIFEEGKEINKKKEIDLNKIIYEQKLTNEKLQDEIYKLKNEIENIKEENSSIKKKHKKYKKIIKNMKLNYDEINAKYIKTENDLNLIRFRDTIKNIIDIFAKVFKISQNKTYIDKVTIIKNKINNIKKAKI